MDSELGVIGDNFMERKEEFGETAGLASEMSAGSFSVICRINKGHR